jgi:hypothetical protein
MLGIAMNRWALHPLIRQLILQFVEAQCRSRQIGAPRSVTITAESSYGNNQYI